MRSQNPNASMITPPRSSGSTKSREDTSEIREMMSQKPSFHNVRGTLGTPLVRKESLSKKLPPESVELKDGDVAYDSDEGFSVIRLKNSAGPADGIQQALSDALSAFIDHSESSSCSSPKSQKQQTVANGKRKGSSNRDTANTSSSTSSTGSSTRSSPRMVPIDPPHDNSSRQSAHTDPSEPDGRYSDHSNSYEYEEDHEDDIDDEAMEATSAAELNSHPEDAATLRSQSRSDESMCLRRKGTGSAPPLEITSTMLKKLRHQNNSLHKSIAEMVRKIEKLKQQQQPPGRGRRHSRSAQKNAPHSATRKKNHRTAPFTKKLTGIDPRVRTEYEMVHTEHENLSHHIQALEKMSSLEEKASALEAQIAELTRQNKELTKEVRCNAKRLIAAGEFQETRTKVHQALQSERNMVHVLTKRKEHVAQIEKHHKQVIEKGLDRISAETSTLDADLLREVQELTQRRKDLQTENQNLTYRVTVLQKAKESATRLLAIEQAKARENFDIEFLQDEVARLRERIRHCDQHSYRNLDASGIDHEEREERTVIEKSEAAMWRQLTMDERNDRHQCVNVFLNMEAKISARSKITKSPHAHRGQHAQVEVHQSTPGNESSVRIQITPAHVNISSTAPENRAAPPWLDEQAQWKSKEEKKAGNSRQSTPGRNPIASGTKPQDGAGVQPNWLSVELPKELRTPENPSVHGENEKMDTSYSSLPASAKDPEWLGAADSPARPSQTDAQKLQKKKVDVPSSPPKKVEDSSVATPLEEKNDLPLWLR